MIKIHNYQYCSGDHTGEAGIITYDNCEILQIIDYRTMTITEQTAHFSNEKVFRKYGNGQWKRIQ